MFRFLLMIALLVMMFGLYDSFAHGGTKMRALATSLGVSAQAENAAPVEVNNGEDSATY